MSKGKPAVPLLLISDEGGSSTARKRGARRDYYSHKMGAGHKSRCSDVERWQLYCGNEHLWVSSGANFHCPFRYLSKEAYPDDVNVQEVRSGSCWSSRDSMRVCDNRTNELRPT